MDTVIAFGSAIAVIILVLAIVVEQLCLLITETTNLVNACTGLKAVFKKFKAKK
ncbi:MULTISPECIES: hypothetical protein [unclassified Lactobacillus]|uniref:hypothetical protein n=1 Tax=unclassified Lactobacillus TaxID=2620435 RepID=UPI0023F95B3D|nr:MULTISPECIES: hypothetical protein [unclassified Lactobacillus]MDF7668589.1 hypothetical protein [Lactobacillus sp. ESL0703]WEV38718.1 hypothetical protein OZX58_00130 [Lactobacillus sp. ESL0680]